MVKVNNTAKDWKSQGICEWRLKAVSPFIIDRLFDSIKKGRLKKAVKKEVAIRKIDTVTFLFFRIFIIEFFLQRFTNAMIISGNKKSKGWYLKIEEIAIKKRKLSYRLLRNMFKAIKEKKKGTESNIPFAE